MNNLVDAAIAQEINTQETTMTAFTQPTPKTTKTNGFVGALKTAFSRQVRTVSTLLSCSALAVAGMVSPALAAEHQLWMYDNGSTTLSGYFYAGELIYANCDQDCYDLDLFLYSNNRLVDSDIEYDAIPVVTAPYEGYFTIEVSMVNCSHSAGCAVAVDSEYGF